jgi:hypothetical protein
MFLYFYYFCIYLFILFYFIFLFIYFILFFRIEKDKQGNRAAVLAFYPSFEYEEVSDNEFISSYFELIERVTRKHMKRTRRDRINKGSEE